MNSINHKIEAETHNCHEAESSFQFLLTTALFYHTRMLLHLAKLTILSCSRRYHVRNTPHCIWFYEAG